VVQTPCINQCEVPCTPRTMTQTPAQTTLVISTSVQSTPRVQKTRASNPISSTYVDPTLESVLPRKTKITCDINNEDTTNSFSVFSMFSQIDDPLTF